MNRSLTATLTSTPCNAAEQMAQVGGPDTLPEYDGSSPQLASGENEWGEQTYSLEDNKGRTWLWLKITSRAVAKNDKNVLPLFFERDTVRGTVEIDFDKADGSKGIVVAVSLVLILLILLYDHRPDPCS